MVCFDVYWLTFVLPEAANAALQFNVTGSFSITVVSVGCSKITRDVEEIVSCTTPENKH